jgi:hypothetical protein
LPTPLLSPLPPGEGKGEGRCRRNVLISCLAGHRSRQQSYTEDAPPCKPVPILGMRILPGKIARGPAGVREGS